MKSINFAVGNYKEYAINGDETKTVKIDVSDIGFIDRFKKAVLEIEDYQKKLEAVISPDEDILVEIDRKAREILNKAFDSDVCSAAFGNKNCFSVTANGNPIIINFLEAFVPIIQQDFKNASEDQKIKIKDKTDKYITPVVSQSNTPIDISKLTNEQRSAILKELQT